MLGKPGTSEQLESKPEDWLLMLKSLLEMIRLLFGYPVECCGPVLSIAKAISYKPLSSPESVLVEEAHETFQNMI
jgi:hypothetical protein